MKFWFGKKGMDEGAGACEVLTVSDSDSGVGVTHSSSILITPTRGGPLAGSGGIAQTPAPSVGGVAAEAKRPAAVGVGLGAQKPLAGVVPRQQEAAPGELPKGPAMPAMAGKGAAVSVQAPVNRLQAAMSGMGAPAPADASKNPRPVMTPVRMASPTAPIKLSPVSAAPASAPAPAAPTASLGAMAAGAGSRPGSPAFGFRPKDGAAPVPGPVSVGPKQAVPLAAAAAAPAAAPAAAAAAPAPDRSGVVERDVDGVVRPKTDQRALYYQLMNGLYDAVLILDDQGHIVDCNSRVTAMLGYSREDTWDIPIEKIITGMSSQMFEHLKRNLAENHHILIDARCFRQDGTSFAGEVGVSTLSLTRGSNIVFAIRNVDRRKSAMDEMRKGQSALEVALAPAFVCDLDGFFLIVNQAMLDAFGIPDEAQAKNVRFIDLLPDAARFFLRASCGEKLRESLRIPTPNGVPVKIELALKPVQSGQTVTAVAGSILQA